MRRKIVFFVCALLIANLNIQAAFSLGIPSLTSEDLMSISMVTEDSGWIVGDKGTILRFSGGSWNVVESPTTSNLKGVDMVSSIDGWAVGFNTLLHYDGMMDRWNDETFRIEGAPGQDEYWRFSAVSMINSDDGWVVGGSGDSALLLHWDGAKWRISQPPGYMKWLSDISMVDSSEGWAVGGGDGSTYTAIRWNGAYWAGHVVGPADWQVFEVFAVSETNVWARARRCLRELPHFS